MEPEVRNKLDLAIEIRDVYAREILDFAGNPAIEVEVLAGGEIIGKASVAGENYSKKEQTENWEAAFDIVKNAFGEYRASWEAAWDEAGSTLEYAFDFMEAAFYNSQEMVIFVSGINTDYSCVRFLETYECERYIRYNRDLLFEDASQEIRRRIEEL